MTTGDNSPVTVSVLGPLREVADVPAAPGPVGVPGRIPLFVGREGELAELERALSMGPGAVVHTVHGLGGIGKSALAARYVLQHAGAYTQVVWISAEGLARIEAGLASFALALEPQLGALPAEALARRATGWLAAHGGWLLVLDNVTAANDLDPLLAAVGSGGGRFLITSRSAVGWNRIGAKAVRLDVLDPAEALVLLAASIGILAESVDGGAQLCARLGFLPLAIVQAAVYIAQSQDGDGPDVYGYLRLLEGHAAEVYAAGDQDADDWRTIARVWHVTSDRLADTPLAGRVLRVLAWFAPDEIPLSLLEDYAEQPALGQAVGRLAAYNMLTHSPSDPADPGGGPRLAVHRLVQAVARTPDPADPHRAPEEIDRARDEAAVLLSDALPDIDPKEVEAWPAYRRVMPHIDALCQHAAPADDSPDTMIVLNRAGLFSLDQGRVAQGMEYLARAYRGSCRIRGEEHPETLMARSNLASAYQDAGDLGQAIPLYERILDDRRRILGEDHLGTLMSLSNLAGACLEAGDVVRAVALQEQAVHDALRILGEDHPQVLKSRHQLATAYQAAGDLGRAIALFEQVGQDAWQVLGEDNPQTLIYCHNLADAYRSAGDLGRAIALFELVFVESCRVLGEEHPNTLSTCRNLASAYQDAGDLGRAILLYEQALDNTLRVLGEDHPDTLVARSNLATAYQNAGHLGRAIPLFEKTFNDSRRLLGEGDQQTLICCANLAIAYRDAGDLGQAIRFYEKAFNDARRALGDDHPLTKTFRARLTTARGHRR
ncbi:MAG TPA: tetratricopeptide repeat protein [Actinocrinis sp.]|nr:tetratricopeptide repeat protein [Actinocrinis sp.]